MTPLRQTMIQAMCQHGFSPRTQHSYLYVVTALARYYRRSPDQLEVDDLQAYFNYLVQERSLSPASCRVYLHGIRFLYLQVLHWTHFDVPLVLPKRPQRIPELLTRQEVARLLAAVTNPKHQALLSVTCFGSNRARAPKTAWCPWHLSYFRCFDSTGGPVDLCPGYFLVTCCRTGTFTSPRLKRCTTKPRRSVAFRKAVVFTRCATPTPPTS